MVDRWPVVLTGRGCFTRVQRSVRRYAHVSWWRLRQVVPVRAEEGQPARMRPRQTHLTRLENEKAKRTLVVVIDIARTRAPVYGRHVIKVTPVSVPSQIAETLDVRS